MEREVSLPHSQEPATCPHSEPDKSSSCSPSHLLNINLNIILLSSPGLFPSAFPTKTLYTPLLSPIRATYPAHLIVLDLLIRILFREENCSLSSSLCILLHSPATSSPLGQKILLSTLLSKALSLSYSVIVRNQVSDPLKTTGEIVVLHISIFVFLFSVMEDIRFCTE